MNNRFINLNQFIEKVDSEMVDSPLQFSKIQEQTPPISSFYFNEKMNEYSPNLNLSQERNAYNQAVFFQESGSRDFLDPLEVNKSKSLPYRHLNSRKNTVKIETIQEEEFGNNTIQKLDFEIKDDQSQQQQYQEFQQSIVIEFQQEQNSSQKILKNGNQEPLQNNINNSKDEQKDLPKEQLTNSSNMNETINIVNQNKISDINNEDKEQNDIPEINMKSSGKKLLEVNNNDQQVEFDKKEKNKKEIKNQKSVQFESPQIQIEKENLDEVSNNFELIEKQDENINKSNIDNSNNIYANEIKVVDNGDNLQNSNINNGNNAYANGINQVKNCDNLQNSNINNGNNTYANGINEVEMGNNLQNSDKNNDCKNSTEQNLNNKFKQQDVNCVQKEESDENTISENQNKEAFQIKINDTQQLLQEKKSNEEVSGDYEQILKQAIKILQFDQNIKIDKSLLDISYNEIEIPKTDCQEYTIFLLLLHSLTSKANRFYQQLEEKIPNIIKEYNILDAEKIKNKLVNIFNSMKFSKHNNILSEIVKQSICFKLFAKKVDKNYYEINYSDDFVTYFIQKQNFITFKLIDKIKFPKKK